MATGRKLYGPPRPVPVEVECATPGEWRWFKRTALEQGWARTTREGRFELTDRPESLPERFHEAMRASHCRFTAKV